MESPPDAYKEMERSGKKQNDVSCLLAKLSAPYQGVSNITPCPILYGFSNQNKVFGTESLLDKACMSFVLVLGFW